MTITNRMILGLGLLAAVSAIAQPIRLTRAAAPVDINATATTTALNLYVETTGNDGNDCLSVSTACATIPGALVKAPHIVRHPIVVTAGIGSFGVGARIMNFLFDVPASTAGASVVIQGTFQNATLSTGPVTGTVSSFTAGSGKTWATVTVSGATWTTDELRGKWIEFTGGTGVGTTKPIVSNTATTITVTGTYGGTSPAPAVGTGFAIREIGTVVTGVLPQVTTPGTTALSSNASFSIEGLNTNPSSPGNGTFLIQRFKFSGAGVNRAFLVSNDSELMIRDCRFELSATSARGVQISDAASVRLINSTANFSNNTITLLEAFAYTMSRRVTIEGNVSDGGGNWVLMGGANQFVSTNNSAKNAFRFLHHGNMLSGLSKWDKFDTATEICVRGDADTSNLTSGIFTINDDDILNCGVAAIDVRGPARVTVTGATGTVLSSAANGIQVTYGGSVQIANTTSLTAANELVVDSANYTLATMRAASPKSIIHLTSLSQVYEQ
jgi:hypothetical protein